MEESNEQSGLWAQFKKIYPMIWPVVFGLGGILMLSGVHLHFQILN